MIATTPIFRLLTSRVHKLFTKIQIIFTSILQTLLIDKSNLVIKLPV